MFPENLRGVNPGSGVFPGRRGLSGRHGQENCQTVTDIQMVQCGLWEK